MNKDRGFIKWQPFDSVISSKEIIKSLLKDKSKIPKPIISEEEKQKIEQNIIEAYYTCCDINIHYYKNGFIYECFSKIKKIDQINKIIYLNNNSKLLFHQIVSIDTK
ncbi:MAG: YolD-like family protein [Firmicutes bacterium]|nr:YolD-like family protein [Bacillota bacterium]